MPNAFIAAVIGSEKNTVQSKRVGQREDDSCHRNHTEPMLQYPASPKMSVAGKMCDGSRRHMSLDWSFGDHNARVQEGARNATLVDQNGAWHLRIKYDPPIIAGEHWDVLIAWKRQYTPSFTEAIIKSSDILKQEWEITV